MHHTLSSPVLVSTGATFLPDMHSIDSLDAVYVDRFDTVEVFLGGARLLLPVADAAELVDKTLAALDSRVSTVRVVA
ncbi:hypothetical protein [Nocardia sp. AG03]|uniref:hypothetical protein n=1 Tax=Nocardia sp. AG03 TaxID=3025312 RepID=UPI00241875C2|nr:hypothetical protein [Nocardia sp. AG03]